MSLFVDDTDFQLYVGDVREQLALLPDESVHCVVTSPPYWGLRDYGTGSWDGGDPACDHVAPPVGGPSVTTATFRATEHPDRKTKQYAQTCGKCGATRTDQQLGLEATPDLFVQNMVEVFREVRRVLRRDGTCWINLGDSFGEKQLQGVPWKVAFALQADGWYLRSDIVWSKPNPMPESVTDRPTKAHEYVFLLTKSARYFFDQEAVREPITSEASLARNRSTPRQILRAGARQPDTDERPAIRAHQQVTEAGRNVRSVWEIATQPQPEAHFATFPEALPERCIRAGTSERGCCPVCGAPWVRELSERTSPRSRDTRRPGEHVPVGGEKLSGAKMQEWIDANPRVTTGWSPSCECRVTTGGRLGRPRRRPPDDTVASQSATTGWSSSCQCGEHDAGDGDGDKRRNVGEDARLTAARNGSPALAPVPCTVLDPFMGSGTTAHVARKLGRRSIGIELNPEYAALCARRLQQLSLLA